MANTTGSGRTQADKERSKQMSRSVTANQAGRKDGKNGKPNAPTAKAQGGPRRSAQGGSGKPPNRGPGPANRAGPGRSPNRPARRSPTALLTWGTAGLVIIIVIVLVAVKVFGGSTPASGPGQTPASPAVVAEVTGVPASVFDTVGVTSAVAPIYPPIVITGQKPLTFADTSGKTLPGVFFFGAEYCPHCAAERWAIIVALSRFGTFHNLGNMQSSASDVDPNTQTFTFHGATYTSKYIVFKSDEYESNELNAAGTEYKILEQPNKVEAKLVDKYNTSTYFPSLSAGELSFPFLDFGNKVLSEENYDPGILSGLTREEIASGLKSAKNSITQAIVASANYLSASVCNVDGQLPSTVCTSKGVMAASKALKLS